MSHVLTPEIEVQTLALLTAKIMDQNAPWTSVAFKYALPIAYECLQATRKFLKEKEAEASVEAEKYWASEEGKKRRADAIARFNYLKKKTEKE